MTHQGDSRIKAFLAANKLGQVGSLYAAVLLSIVIGFGSSVITTRMLNPAGYGDLKFILNLFQFLAVVSGFGIFPTGGLLLTRFKENDAAKHEMIGALMATTGVISLASMALTIAFSFFQHTIFHNDLGIVILLFSPLMALGVFQPAIEYILQGDNQIYRLSFFRTIPGILYIVFMLGVNFLHPVNLTLTLLIQLITGAGVTAVIVLALRPRYTRLRENRKLIWELNRTYGRHVYFGSLSSVATSYLSTFLLSYFLDNTKVGFFSLAITITAPLMQITSVFGTTYFKEFASHPRLPQKVTLTAVGLTVVALTLFLLLIKPLVLLIYTDKFGEVVSLTYIVAFGSTLYGMGDYFNRFLGAHGKGKELRNGAFAVGFVNIVGFSVFITLFGAQGAAFTQLLAGAVYFLTMVFYYRKFTKQQGPVPGAHPIGEPPAGSPADAL